MSSYSICFFSLCFILTSTVFTDEISTNRSLVAISSETLTLAKQLVFNSVSIVHWQSMIMILSSEKDFILNTSSTLIRFPHSYRATILQMTSELQRVFTDIDSLMYRLQLAMKRIPDYIKTILRIAETGSTLMKERMMPTIFNNVLRTTHENMLMMNATIQHWNSFVRLFNDVRIIPIPSMNQADIILADEFDLRKIISQIDLLVQQITENLNFFLQYLVRLDQYANSNIVFQNNRTALLSNLYMMEQIAYFIYQTAFVFTHFSHRYLIYPLAGSGRFVILNSSDDRLNSFDTLSKRWSEIAKDINERLVHYEYEYETNCLLLKEVYENLMKSK